MKIKEVEQRTGISSANIRFYEKEGLLNPRRSKENNYRDYAQQDVEAAGADQDFKTSWNLH